MKKGGTLALVFLFVGAGVARMIGKDSACGIENVDCIASGSGSAYTGTVSKTKAGVECQAWNDQSPHQHDDGTEMEHNHCRNPDGKPGLWCYTKDSNTTWDFCEVRKCRDCKRGLDFKDSQQEKDIVKLKGRCTVKKNAKTVLAGIKTKAECLTACLANKNAKGCQFRKVKKMCKAVTAYFEKASYRLGVTCWRFDDAIKHAADVAVFSNMTKTRKNWHHCGGGLGCSHPKPICCDEEDDPPSCCPTYHPECGNTGDGLCYRDKSFVKDEYDFQGTYDWFKKHWNHGVGTKEQMEKRTKAREKNLGLTNTIYHGNHKTESINEKKRQITKSIQGGRWNCKRADKTSNWECKHEQVKKGLQWIVKYDTMNGHYFWEKTIAGVIGAFIP